MEQEKIRKALEKEEGSSSESRRKFDRGIAFMVITALSVAFILFQLYTAQFGLLSPLRQRAVHLGFILTLSFILFPARKKWRDSKLGLGADLLMAALSLSSMAYVYKVYLELNWRAGSYNSTDIVLGLIAIVLVLEATRRVAGWQLSLIAFLFLLYGLFGPYFPAMVQHKGFAIDELAPFMFLTTEGIFGLPLGVSASLLVVYVAFAAFLEQSGAGEFFIQLANAVTGRSKGGPAKAAVVASGFFGTFSGSAVANVVGTGTFTIPLMKRVGYAPHFAGAVEAVASSGGQLMPPVMGSAAFIMAEMLGISYLDVAKAAAIPAILYYVALFFAIHFEAGRINLQGLSADLLPNFRKVLRKDWYLLLPPALLIYLMLVMDWSAQKAGFWGIVSTVVVSYFSKEHRMGREKLLKAFMGAARGALQVGIACAAMGIIIGIFGITGLGAKLSGLITDLSGGNLILLLFLTMIASLILGMGVPTTAAYLILAVLVAPAMIKMGVYPLAAHLFVFYFGIISAITPPVAVGAYAGAAIAGSNPWKTGVTAMRLGLVAFLLPYMFVLGPELLGDGSPLLISWGALTGLVGVMALAAGLTGYFLKRLRTWERVLILAAAVALISPTILVSAIGLAYVVLEAFYQFASTKLGRGAAMTGA